MPAQRRFEPLAFGDSSLSPHQLEHRGGPGATASCYAEYMVEPTLLSTLDNGVLTLTLNRPAKLNAIDNALGAALLERLQAAANDPEVRVIRLRGNGRAFCAGRDVGAPPTERDLELVQGVAVAIVRQPKPVVAAVHGWTVGAGFEWAMDADVVLAAEDARFKLPEASIGVFVTGGLVATLPAIAGLSRAKALMLFGDEFGAGEAVEWGLAHRAVPSHLLDEVSMAACRRLAALDPTVVAHYKRVLNAVGLDRFDLAIEAESNATRALGKAAPLEK
jgi:2-(1,2-epoxy-1,2-dihydrophenyl)acetyl-CoA isomerase